MAHDPEDLKRVVSTLRHEGCTTNNSYADVAILICLEDLEDAAAAILSALLARGWTPPRPGKPVAWAYVNEDGECAQIEWGAPRYDPSVTPLFSVPPVSNTGRGGE